MYVLRIKSNACHLKKRSRVVNRSSNYCQEFRCRATHMCLDSYSGPCASNASSKRGRRHLDAWIISLDGILTLPDLHSSWLEPAPASKIMPESLLVRLGSGCFAQESTDHPVFEVSPADYDRVAHVLRRWKQFGVLVYFHVLLEAWRRQGTYTRIPALAWRNRNDQIRTSL